MEHGTKEQVRLFRLHAHHLDRWYSKGEAEAVAGACGLQNSPPGAWESALYNRIPAFSLQEMRALLEEKKTLLQAWSFRGAPVVFPTAESDAFLSALVPQGEEPWIYTKGIGLALDLLELSQGELLPLLREVLPRLDSQTVESKVDLDRVLAQWMEPLLPPEKRERWNRPSPYGSPDKQTVGGAVVSFLLRPCSFLGLVVFGKRAGVSPTYTSYRSWVGHPLQREGCPEQKLVRKYLHCYGPATPAGLTDWLGCSPQQAGRIWETAQDEIQPVSIEGKTRFLLSADREQLLSPPQPQREVHLLAGHDPYLGLQDRELILQDKARQRLVWQTVSNPGAILHKGEIAGIWKGKKKGKGMEVEVTLWGDAQRLTGEIEEQAEGYAQFQQRRLEKITYLE